jgi:hypothetical protein
MIVLSPSPVVAVAARAHVCVCRYIDSVGPALALNLYTAVANNITHAGRIAICRGALAHTDLRTTLDALVVPVVLVASPDDTLVRVWPCTVWAGVCVGGGEEGPMRQLKRAGAGAACPSYLLPTSLVLS